MKRMVGKRIFDEYYPDRYYNHDAEWIDGLIKIGETKHKEPLTLNRRAAESDLLAPERAFEVDVDLSVSGLHGLVYGGGQQGLGAALRTARSG